MPQDDWQSRLRSENAELRERMTKLHTFIQSEEFKVLDSVERGDLLNQYTGMETYARMLLRRISRLPSDG